jgi:hypothetical protein
MPRVCCATVIQPDIWTITNWLDRFPSRSAIARGSINCMYALAHRVVVVPPIVWCCYWIHCVAYQLQSNPCCHVYFADTQQLGQQSTDKNDSWFDQHVSHSYYHVCGMHAYHHYQPINHPNNQSKHWWYTACCTCCEEIWAITNWTDRFPSRSATQLCCINCMSNGSTGIDWHMCDWTVHLCCGGAAEYCIITNCPDRFPSRYPPSWPFSLICMHTSNNLRTGAVVSQCSFVVQYSHARVIVVSSHW